MANKNNYNKMSKPKVEPKVVEQVEAVETVETPTPVVQLEPQTEPEVVKESIGVVKDCVRLNVREKPNKDAKILFTIDVNTEVVINTKKPTDGWWYVCTEAGDVGYCMKDYITVKS